MVGWRREQPCSGLVRCGAVRGGGKGRKGKGCHMIVIESQLGLISVVRVVFFCCLVVEVVVVVMMVVMVMMGDCVGCRGGGGYRYCRGGGEAYCSVPYCTVYTVHSIPYSTDISTD